MFQILLYLATVVITAVVAIVATRYYILRKLKKKLPETLQNQDTKTLNGLIEKLYSHLTSLKKLQERFEHFYDATQDGIILHDQGKILLVNQAVLHLTGYSENELLKLHVNKIFKEQKQKSGFKIPLKPYTYETEAVKKNGIKFPVEIQESAIEYEGRMVMASVLRDITKRKTLENQLKEERLMRLSWVIDGQEIERQRLARELHDGLGQSLIALKLKLESIEPENDKNRKKIEEIKQYLNKTIEEIRRISYDLMPAGLNEFGAVNAIRRLCNSIAENTDISISFFADTALSHMKFNNKSSMYLYRIAQEALNNSLKHAEADTIEVELHKNENFIELSIKDNGKGFAYGSTYKYVGNGIYNMRERTNMLHGSFDIDSKPGKGTNVTVKIPLNQIL